MDDFTGGMANWSTVTRISQDLAAGSGSAPSAKGSPVGQSAFAYRDLGTTMNMACVSANINVLNRTASQGIDLMRLRTAANGAISKVALDTTGRVIVRSDFAGTQVSSLQSLAPGWNRVELCGSDISGGGVWDLYLNGVKVVNAWAANTGTVPLGRIQIGDTANKTWTANFDDVQVDQFVGEVVVAPDTAGTDDARSAYGLEPVLRADPDLVDGIDRRLSPITYRIYRDGDPTSIGQTTSTTYMDPGLTPGSTHTYTVDAVTLPHQRGFDEPGIGVDPGLRWRHTADLPERLRELRLLGVGDPTDDRHHGGDARRTQRPGGCDGSVGVRLSGPGHHHDDAVHER